MQADFINESLLIKLTSFLRMFITPQIIVFGFITVRRGVGIFPPTVNPIGIMREKLQE